MSRMRGRALTDSTPPPLGATTQRLGPLALLSVVVLLGWATWATVLREPLSVLEPDSLTWADPLSRVVFWLFPALTYLVVTHGREFWRPVGLTFPLGRAQVARTIVMTGVVGLLLFWGTAVKLDMPAKRVLSHLLIGLHTGWSAPLFEEAVFRGVVLAELLNWMHRSSTDAQQLRFKYWLSQLWAGTLFLAVHWPYWLSHHGLSKTLGMSVPLLFIALILGFVFAHTRSLWACIFIHWLNNQLSLL